MPKTAEYVKPLYADSIQVDEKTGLPFDYHSLFAAYRPLVLASAERVRIPEQDREDAVQEVMIKFWLKKGLDLYDPERKTKFATLLRNWSGAFMLQERDKSVKAFKRNLQVDPQEWASFEIAARAHTERDVLSSTYIEQWLEDASAALRDNDAEHLVPLLELCVWTSDDGRTPSRAEIAAHLGCKISRSSALLKELRSTLTDLGMGIESLHD